MSDANSLPPENDADDELKNALMAAFGDEGISLLDDDDDFDEIPEECLAAANKESQATDLDSICNALDGLDDENDSPRTRWIKQISKAIFANHLGALSNCDRLARDSASQANRFVLFAIGDQQFGLPLGNVCEIARYPNVTDLPRTSPWLRGVANFRGQILSVTDLRSLFDIPLIQPLKGEKIVVIRGSQTAATTALVVERVLGIRNPEGKTEDTSGICKGIATFARGCATFDQAKVVLIDPDQILRSAERLQSHY